MSGFKIKHYNTVANDGLQGLVLERKAEGGKRKMIPPKVIQEMAKEEAENDNVVRQRCFYCGQVYAISYIRQVIVAWRKVEPVCAMCRKDRGIKAADCVR